MGPFITSRVLPGPVWLHFLLAGVVLQLVLSVAFPEPKPVLGPPSEERLAAMAGFYERTMARPLDTAARERLIDTALREDLLFREAVARSLYLDDPAVAQRILLNMRFIDPDTREPDTVLLARGFELGMHLTDEVIRRRLIQVMEQLLVATESVAEADEAMLLDHWREHQDSYSAPPAISFEHQFFPNVDASQLEQLKAGTPAAAELAEMARPFLAGQTFSKVSPRQIQAKFGIDFSTAFNALLEQSPALNTWLGPIQSVFGWHMIRLQSIEPGSVLPLSEVKSQVAWDVKLMLEKRALDSAVDKLLAQYEVVRT